MSTDFVHCSKEILQCTGEIGRRLGSGIAGTLATAVRRSEAPWLESEKTMTWRQMIIAYI